MRGLVGVVCLVNGCFDEWCRSVRIVPSLGVLLHIPAFIAGHPAVSAL